MKLYVFLAFAAIVAIISLAIVEFRYTNADSEYSKVEDKNIKGIPEKAFQDAEFLAVIDSKGKITIYEYSESDKFEIVEIMDSSSTISTASTNCYVIKTSAGYGMLICI